MTAFPPNMASTSPSGQTVVQAAQPMQEFASIFGCCDCGPREMILPFSAAERASASRFFKPRRCITRKGRMMGAAMKKEMKLSILFCSASDAIAHDQHQTDVKDRQ